MPVRQCRKVMTTIAFANPVQLGGATTWVQIWLVPGSKL